jgi:hypothetical protein
MIYLATPYSHPDHAVMEARFVRACQLAGALMSRGEIVFCPIAHTHPIAVQCELPRGWDFWERYDREMLSRASRLIVAQMDGWDVSRGIAGEARIAAELGVPVRYATEEAILRKER